MNKFIILTLVLLATATNCPSGTNSKVDSCASISKHTGCTSYYEFVYDYTSAKVTADPRKCVSLAGSDPHCSADQSELCWPPCAPRKVGGIGGLICTQFFPQTNCANWYADNSGDRWC